MQQQVTGGEHLFLISCCFVVADKLSELSPVGVDCCTARPTRDISSRDQWRLMAEKSIGEEHFTRRLKDNARYMCKSVAIYQLAGNRLDILSVLPLIHYGRRCEGGRATGAAAHTS